MATATQERTARDFEPSTLLGGGAAIGATHRVMGDLAELSISTAKEGARLVAEVQMTAIDALRDTQTAALRWQTLWLQALTDPLHVFPKVFLEAVDTTQRALALTGANARVVVQSIDRLQTVALDAGGCLRETLTATSTIGELARRG